MVDQSKARAPQDIHWQSEVDQVKSVEGFCAKLQGRRLGTGAAAEGRILDQGKIEIVHAWTAERIATQRSEASRIRPGPTGNINRNREERGIVSAPAEIIFANRPAGGKNRNSDLIRPVASPRAQAGLLNSGIDREWRTAGEGRDV